MKFGRALLCSAACFVLSCGAVLAQPAVKLHLSGVLLQKTDGKIARKPVAGLTLRQGDVVEYEIDATNTGNEPASGFRMVGPVPAHMTFVSGSASAAQPSAVEYSIDGKTWSPRPMLAVKTAHGVVRKPAPAASYVSVRFVAAKPLAPKATFHYRYRVVVK